MSLSDADQRTQVPESFLLVTLPGWTSRSRPYAKISADELAHVRERHDFCEDLCQQLLPGLQALHDDGVNSDELLSRCAAGLAQPDSGVSEGETTWILARLAELANWRT